jgi:hypothetical protein
MDDMFGGDDEERDEDGETAAEAAATVARQARMAAAKKLKDDKDAADGKSGAKKEKPAEKSLVVLEVKPWEADTNLEAVRHSRENAENNRLSLVYIFIFIFISPIHILTSLLFSSSSFPPPLPPSSPLHSLSL